MHRQEVRLMMRIPRNKRFLRALGLLAALVALPSAAQAERVVSSVAELQAAVVAANAGSGDLTIALTDGTYALSGHVWIGGDGVTIRGQSGNRDAVVLEGSGMTSGATHVFQISGNDVTIEDLTLRRVRQHAIQIHGESPYGADRTVLRNLRIEDTGEQMVKVSYRDGDGSTSDDGLVEGCSFEFTAGIGPQYYIGGVDAHAARNWTVRGCTFRSIRSPEATVAEHAVHFWSGSEGTLVERNLIVNCDRGIGFGLGTRGHQGGVVRNNMIYHADLGGDRADVSIELETALGTEVYNNTIYQEHGYPAAISARWGGSNVTVTNNLIRVAGGTSNAIWARDGATITQSNNVVDAQSSWFVDPAAADLHVKEGTAAVVDQATPLAGLTTDFDGDPRPLGSAPDIGADEVSGTVSGLLFLSSWGAVKSRYRE